MWKRVLLGVVLSGTCSVIALSSAQEMEGAARAACIKCIIAQCPIVLFNGDLVQTHRDDSTGTMRTFKQIPTGYHASCAIESDDDEFLGVCPHDDCMGEGELLALAAAVEQEDINTVRTLMANNDRIVLNQERQLLQVASCEDREIITRQFDLSRRQTSDLRALRD